MILPVQSLVCLAAFGLALPLAISLFPQMSEVSACPVAAGGLTAGTNHGLFALLGISPVPVGPPPFLEGAGFGIPHVNSAASLGRWRPLSLRVGVKILNPSSVRAAKSLGHPFEVDVLPQSFSEGFSFFISWEGPAWG